MTSDLYCRLCGEPLFTGMVASGRRACCLNDTPIVGACPTHGPVGPHHAATTAVEDTGGDDATSATR